MPIRSNRWKHWVDVPKLRSNSLSTATHRLLPPLNPPTLLLVSSHTEQTVHFIHFYPRMGEDSSVCFLAKFYSFTWSDRSQTVESLNVCFSCFLFRSCTVFMPRPFLSPLGSYNERLRRNRLWPSNQPFEIELGFT